MAIQELDDKIMICSDPLEMRSLIQQREHVKATVKNIEQEIVQVNQMVKEVAEELKQTDTDPSSLVFSSEQYISHTERRTKPTHEPEHHKTQYGNSRADNPATGIDPSVGLGSSSPEIYPAKRQKQCKGERATDQMSQEVTQKKAQDPEATDDTCDLFDLRETKEKSPKGPPCIPGENALNHPTHWWPRKNGEKPEERNQGQQMEMELEGETTGKAEEETRILDMRWAHHMQSGDSYP
ncbi:UNVERIFIED_CONTAM: hypothetical protein K2H54_004896 [Gekko kuhli]